MLEVLTEYMPKVEKSAILSKLGLQKEQYFVVSAHRKENIAYEKNCLNLCEILNLVCRKYGFPIIVTTHPRTRKIIEKYEIKFNNLVRLEKPFGLSDYITLQINAKATLRNCLKISVITILTSVL